MPVLLLFLFRIRAEMKVRSRREAGQLWAVVQRDQLTKSSFKAEEVACFQMDCAQAALACLVKTPDLDESIHQVKVFSETGALYLDGVSPAVRETVIMLQKVLAANRQWSEAASFDDIHEVVQTLDQSGCFGENRTTGTLKLFPKRTLSAVRGVGGQASRRCG